MVTDYFKYEYLVQSKGHIQTVTMSWIKRRIYSRSTQHGNSVWLLGDELQGHENYGWKQLPSRVCTWLEARPQR